MKIIRFTVGQCPYNAGEFAGFEDEVAEEYVNAKVAVFDTPKKADPAKEPTK